MTMEDIVIKTGTYSALWDDAMKIRDEVFCGEQGISRDIEIDRFDRAATHVVLYLNGLPVSTGRIICDDGVYYIGRVATIRKYRGNGYGKMIVEALADWALCNKISEVHLHAQKHAVGFYEKIGFRPYGDIFFEAGIEHISMVMKKEA